MPQLEELCQQVAAASAPLNIVGGDTKREFLTPAVRDAQPLDVSGHAGIIDFEPKELVLRARAGTRIADLVATLAAERQILGFDPPGFGGQATLGGTIACGLSGARRPWYGAARDFVLGLGLINASGEYVEFGGQVMKNVAGFDVSRLVCGSFGTLGIIADVSLKTLPAPEAEVTLVQARDRADAHGRMIEYANRSLPISGLAWSGGQLFIRLSGARPAVEAARKSLGGERAPAPWEQIADYSHFKPEAALWRVSVAPASDDLLDEAVAFDWGGGQRWLTDPAFDPRERLTRGHATLAIDRDSTGIPRNHPLPTVTAELHRRLKSTFDPRGIFNLGRMYPDC